MLKVFTDAERLTSMASRPLAVCESSRTASHAARNSAHQARFIAFA
jgi:hypothetical protein